MIERKVKTESELKRETLKHKLWTVPISLAVATASFMITPLANSGPPAKPHTEQYQNITLSAQKLGLEYNVVFWRSNSPTQPQLDHYLPVLKEEIDKLPEGLLETCVDGINLTGHRLETFFRPRGAIYDRETNIVNLTLPNHLSKLGEIYLVDVFWHELHHGCDYNLATKEEHEAYESLREKRPKGDLTGYVWEYSKTNRAEDEATLVELLANNYPEYLRRTEEDPILREKGIIIEEKYHTWTNGVMNRDYWQQLNDNKK